MEKLKTPTMIWQDFNPEELPLEISEISTRQQDEIFFENLYFTGRVLEDGTKSRVFAVICGKKSGTAKPAVLLLNSPEKPISEDDLAYLANKGFLAMSIDFRGESESENFTVYPEQISYANFNDDEKFVINKSASETMWYEYALNSMRAVSVLKEKSNVKTVSLLTVGGGSTVGLIVAAIDKRISNGAVIFGDLHIEIDGRAEISETSEKEKIAEALAKNELLDIWTMGIAPQAYVPLVEIPLYVVCGGNSQSADVVAVSETFPRLNEKSRLLILPNTLDYLCDDVTNGVVRWLKGGETDCELKLSAAVSKNMGFAVELKTTADLKDLELWYTRDNTQFSKNWVLAELNKGEDDNTYFAELDLYEQVSNVSAIAVCRQKISVSTPLFNVVVKQSANLKLPTSVLYSGSDNCFVAVNKSGSWHGESLKAEIAKGYLNIRGVKGTTLGTFALCDKSVLNKDADTISFDICCDFKQTITVTYVAGFGIEEESFSAKAELLGDGKWQRITLNSQQFKRDTDGHGMSKDAKIDLIIFDCPDVFIVNNIYIV